MDLLTPVLWLLAVLMLLALVCMIYLILRFVLKVRSRLLSALIALAAPIASFSLYPLSAVLVPPIIIPFLIYLLLRYALKVKSARSCLLIALLSGLVILIALGAVFFDGFLVLPWTGCEDHNDLCQKPDCFDDGFGGTRCEHHPCDFAQVRSICGLWRISEIGLIIALLLVAFGMRRRRVGPKGS